MACARKRQATETAGDVCKTHVACPAFDAPGGMVAAATPSEVRVEAGTVHVVMLTSVAGRRHAASASPAHSEPAPQTAVVS